MPIATEILSPMQEEFLRTTVIDNPYILDKPTASQAMFLLAQEDEVLYGGAAGGGKSIALLAGALQFAMMPDYHALLLRRSFSDLTQPRALIPLSFEWLSNTEADWSERDHRWAFPSGATLTFGHMNSEKDKFGYQGAAYNYVGFDELTQFSMTMYTYLFSRIRRGTGVKIPGRMRAASNPGGEGHGWVKSRFLNGLPYEAMEIFDEETRELSTRLFIPAKLADNPHLDQRDYKKKLGSLDPVTRAQLLRGDWDIMAEGNMFKREWFKIVDAAPADIVETVRAWDLAATPPTPQNPDPDYTCGAKLSRTSRNTIVIHNVKRIRGNPAEVQALMKQTANEDGHGVAIRIEQEPGAAGKSLIYTYGNQLLVGYDVQPVPATGAKEVRAGPFSAASFRGDVVLLRGAWNSWWLDQIVGFPAMSHDDTVDAPAHAFNCLMEAFSLELRPGPIGGYSG